MKKNRPNSKSKRLVNWILVVICVIWLIPTLGLFISSFRTRDDVLTTGWWTVFPHREWFQSEEIPLDASLDRTKPMQIAGVTATFEEFRA